MLLVSQTLMPWICTPLKDPTCTHNSQADDKQVGPTCTAMATIHLVIIECG